MIYDRIIIKVLHVFLLRFEINNQGSLMSSCYFIYLLHLFQKSWLCFPCCLLGGGNKEFKIIKSFEFLIYLVQFLGGILDISLISTITFIFIWWVLIGSLKLQPSKNRVILWKGFYRQPTFDRDSPTTTGITKVKLWNLSKRFSYLIDKGLFKDRNRVSNGMSPPPFCLKKTAGRYSGLFSLVRKLERFSVLQGLAMYVPGINITLQKVTLLGTNISVSKSLLKMIFLFQRWDMWSFPGE